MVVKLSELYLQLRKSLLPGETAMSAASMAREVLCFTTGKTREKLLADADCYVGDDVIAATAACARRLRAGEPLAYVLGEWEFYGLPLYIDRRVLIPRDDTAAVTALAVKQAIFLPQNPRILDLCTGAGCIGLAIASKVHDARVTLADVSKDALAVAKSNAQRNHLLGRVATVQADAMGTPSAFLGKFDMLVSNPPYVTTQEMDALPASVREFEPHLALHGGEDGLDFYRAIAQNYTPILKDGGYICLEFGMGQGDRVCAILAAAGYTILERSRDNNDIERAVLAQLVRKENEHG